ncbi:MAG: flavodoxin family protein [Flavobacteriales bacterium]|nr:flavodoxin family protein [Flavobacteriales bacterium]
MKVLLINGSPHTSGCTYTALSEVASTLNAHGIETEILHVGVRPVISCQACGLCKKEHRCIHNDIVNLIIEKAEEADGFIFGSPVHYAAASGAMTTVMDRVLYAGSPAFAYKPAAVVVSARRGGCTAAYDQLNKYIGISRMIAVPSQYWNMVHGATAEDVARDEEGLQTMRTIGRNMAWLLRLIENGKKSGIPMPETEAVIRTNFIR